MSYSKFRKKIPPSQIVHYDRLKPFLEPPPASNVPTRNKPRNFQLFQDSADTHKHIDGAINHKDCVSFLQAHFSLFTPKPAVGRTTASSKISKIVPSISSAPVRREVTRSPSVFSQSLALEQPSPHTQNDVAIQSPKNLPNDIQPLISENAFLHGRQSPRDNVMEIVDAAARNLREHLPKTGLQCSYDPIRQHKEKHNRFSRHIFQTY